MHLVFIFLTIFHLASLELAFAQFKIEEISMELSINNATFYIWKKNYGGMETSA
jgi:hypothetical protein